MTFWILAFLCGPALLIASHYLFELQQRQWKEKRGPFDPRRQPDERITLIDRRR